jgi:nucleoside-diphosphate-sugar epimerase
MVIFVMGCDGYIGNAITQRLLYNGHKVIGFDNYWRRRWIEEMESRSAIPIYTMARKEEIFNEIGDFRFVLCDISKHKKHDKDFCGDFLELEHAFDYHKPDVVINLAHNPSGPYSMKSLVNANAVLKNNIISTNNLLWLIKKHVPDCHYITIGTAGEYDHYGNIDIEEGYFEFEYKGRRSKEMIFPRRPGSLYHSSKVSATYLIDYLARAWDLRCTDVMQGIVFGMYTDEIDATQVWSRFDSDEAGGTVINRFIVQALLGEKLTVYGDGQHQRSFLSLNDSVQALMIAVNNPAKKGKVQTWNQLSEWRSMNEIAELVKETGFNFGMNIDITWIDTPRVEYTGDHYYHFVTDNLTSKGYEPTREIREEIHYAFNKLRKHDLEQLRKVVMPKIIFKKMPL